jgi:hypothetical protein
MTLLVSAVALGVLVALLRYGRLALSRIAALPIRAAWLVLVALLMQLPLLRSASTVIAELSIARGFFLASFVLIGLFVWLNRRLAGVLILGIGLFANLIVIVANQGFMPIAPETLVDLHPGSEMSVWRTGEHYPYSKDIILAREDTRLSALSDILVMPYRLPRRYAFSPGDLLIAAGIIVLLANLPAPYPSSARRKIKQSSQPTLEIENES